MSVRHGAERFGNVVRARVDEMAVGDGDGQAGEEEDGVHGGDRNACQGREAVRAGNGKQTARIRASEAGLSVWQLEQLRAWSG